MVAINPENELLYRNIKREDTPDLNGDNSSLDLMDDENFNGIGDEPANVVNITLHFYSYGHKSWHVFL